jgi:hypothetical protein
MRFYACLEMTECMYILHKPLPSEYRKAHHVMSISQRITPSLDKLASDLESWKQRNNENAKTRPSIIFGGTCMKLRLDG